MFTSKSNKEDRGNLTFTTPKGKVIEIYMPERGAGGYKIQFKSGGQLPKEFDGSFTSRNSAKKAVEVYLSRMGSSEEEVSEEPKKVSKSKKVDK